MLFELTPLAHDAPITDYFNWYAEFVTVNFLLPVVALFTFAYFVAALVAGFMHDDTPYKMTHGTHRFALSTAMCIMLILGICAVIDIWMLLGTTAGIVFNFALMPIITAVLATLAWVTARLARDEWRTCARREF